MPKIMPKICSNSTPAERAEKVFCRSVTRTIITFIMHILLVVDHWYWSCGSKSWSPKSVSNNLYTRLRKWLIGWVEYTSGHCCAGLFHAFFCLINIYPTHKSKCFIIVEKGATKTRTDEGHSCQHRHKDTLKINLTPQRLDYSDNAGQVRWPLMTSEGINYRAGHLYENMLK